MCFQNIVLQQIVLECSPLLDSNWYAEKGSKDALVTMIHIINEHLEQAQSLVKYCL